MLYFVRASEHGDRCGFWRQQSEDFYVREQSSMLLNGLRIVVVWTERVFLGWKVGFEQRR